mmetsp:Transcript_18415/g.40025  ORF Transcript_18415/g.40025 Transcript_18415/m.40025 type:complete len:474 (-) Transcript_18415:270-1691(-)
MFLLRTCLRNGSVGTSGRIITARHTTSKLSTPKPATLRILNNNNSVVRTFSSSGGGNDGSDNNNDGSNNNEDQSFFLKDEDSLPAPPSYVRDAVTGKWTDETHATLSPKDRTLLNLNSEEKSEEVMNRLEERWKNAASSSSSSDNNGNGDDVGVEEGILGMKLNDEHDRVARRIQEQRLALGPIGRDPSYSTKKGDTDGEIHADGGTEKPLTPREYEALKTYAAKEHGVSPKEFAKLEEDDPDLIPHNTVASGAEGSTDAKQFFDADLDLAYLNPKLNRRAFADEGTAGEDPFADLLPSDLNPARKVNRRHAKPIPRRLLHQNNLSLLRRYTTPGGKIMNRVQSRLGAKDQRKISKLVKRARQLGLIPYMGQWKYEDHGYVHERGLADSVGSGASAAGEEAEGKRDWEVELEKRGLWPLADETEVVKRHYGMDKMMEHIAGPRGSEKRDTLEELIGGVGALVPDEKKAEGGSP